MPEPLLEDVRFVVDENLVALGRVLRQLRPREMAIFGHDELADVLPGGMLDSEWIPIVGDHGWVAITNDKRLRTRPQEASLAVRHKLRVVHLHGHVGHQRTWDQATRLLSRWDAIETALADNPGGPVWLSAQAKGLQIMQFAPGSPKP